MVAQKGTPANRKRIWPPTHILPNGILGRTLEAGVRLLLLQLGNCLHPVKRQTHCNRHTMKAGALLLLFVLANFLYAVYRVLKDSGFISSNHNPASLEHWLNS